jgi:hypothetical protein
MDRAAIRARRRERWLQRAERARDAFGLVFALVIVTYVLTSLLENRGWSAVILVAATRANLGGGAGQLPRLAAPGADGYLALGADDRPRHDRRRRQ